jgi:ketosteroid isomerase-like protein
LPVINLATTTTARRPPTFDDLERLPYAAKVPGEPAALPARLDPPADGGRRHRAERLPDPHAPALVRGRVDSRVMDHVDVVQAWIAAWNAGDADALVSLAVDDVELEMPMGARRGIPALRDVVAKQSYGMRLYVGPQALQVDADTVVALGPIELRSVEEGDKVVERQENAGAGFTVRGDRVARFKPYPDAVTALRAEGFDESIGD